MSNTTYDASGWVVARGRTEEVRRRRREALWEAHLIDHPENCEFCRDEPRKSGRRAPQIDPGAEQGPKRPDARAPSLDFSGPC